MSEANERISEALAAHLDYLELGGPKPDTSHLTPSELEQLDDLIGALEMTEGVAFGLGREAAAAPPAPDKAERPEESRLLIAKLRAALPADIRIDSEPPGLFARVGDVAILDALIVGTFGGRVRVWLMDLGKAQELEGNNECLRDLGRVFGVFADTAAIALVARDLSCLIVQPEDCAPNIHIPSGSLVGRRYKQPIRPVDDAVAAFINELIPYWDPVPAFDSDARLTIDAATVTDEQAAAAVERQRAIGERARKGNPKKDALLAFGNKEISALKKLADGLFDGSVDAEEVESRIERLAQNR
jgi:hypothetical protein